MVMDPRSIQHNSSHIIASYGNVRGPGLIGFFFFFGQAKKKLGAWVVEPQTSEGKEWVQANTSEDFLAKFKEEET